MPVHDELGKRMKTYEAVSQTKLMRRTPVAIRIDGKAFHTFTRGMRKPFDEVLIQSMQETMQYLCKNIQGCVLGYTQSDEITLILVDYKELNTSAWFDNEVQKICSISASMATMAFNRAFAKNVDEWGRSTFPGWDDGGTDEEVDADLMKLNNVYQNAITKGAMFDARCFNIPKEEVANLIYWRQLDATRNSIQMIGQANFSHNELQGKSCNQIQDMLHELKGINWNNYPTTQKRGSCCVKNGREDRYYSAVLQKKCTRGIIPRDPDKSEREWIVDNEIPIFKGDGRQYIEELIWYF